VSRSVCAGTTAATAAATIGEVGRRLLREEAAGPPTRRVLRIVSHDPRFVAAVAADDPAALRAQVGRFFRNRTLHVVRVRAVDAAGRLVGDVGGPYALQPASAPVRAHGRRIGTVTLSVQDDTGYVKLMRRLARAQVVLRTDAGPVPGAFPLPASVDLPSRGTLVAGGRTYAVVGLAATAFPSSPLHVWLLVPDRATGAPAA
jgi:hypothetical protein